MGTGHVDRRADKKPTRFSTEVEGASTISPAPTSSPWRHTVTPVKGDIVL